MGQKCPGCRRGGTLDTRWSAAAAAACRSRHLDDGGEGDEADEQDDDSLEPWTTAAGDRGDDADDDQHDQDPRSELLEPVQDIVDEWIDDALGGLDADAGIDSRWRGRTQGFCYLSIEGDRCSDEEGGSEVHSPSRKQRPPGAEVVHSSHFTFFAFIRRRGVRRVPTP